MLIVVTFYEEDNETSDHNHDENDQIDFWSIERLGDIISCDIHGCRTAMGRLVERFGTPPPRTRS